MRLLFILPIILFLVSSTCKKTPTFPIDNPNDVLSDNYIVSTPKNISYEYDGGSEVQINWETSHFNSFEVSEARFLVQIISNSNDTLLKSEVEFSNSVTLQYNFEPGNEYLFSVSTIYQNNISAPAVTQSLNLYFGEINTVWVQTNDEENITVQFELNAPEYFELRPFLINKISGDTLLSFSVYEIHDGYYASSFSGLDNHVTYELGITQIVNGFSKSDKFNSIAFNTKNNALRTFSFDKTNEGIAFYDPIYVTHSRQTYIVATDEARRTLYIINKKSKEIEYTITLNSAVSNLTMGPNFGFYFLQNGDIYKGNALTGEISPFLQDSQEDIQTILGIIGFEHENLIYKVENKTHFYDTTQTKLPYLVEGNISSVCVAWMEDQFIAIENNSLHYYSFRSNGIPLVDTYSSEEGVEFSSCVYNDNLDAVFVTGYNSNSESHFFAKLDKGQKLSNYTTISTESAFNELYFFRYGQQIIVNTLDASMESGSPFYIYNYEIHEFNKTNVIYNSLQAPEYHDEDNGYLLYSTGYHPNSDIQVTPGIIEELHFGTGWILIDLDLPN